MNTEGEWHVTKEFITRKYIYDSEGALVAEVNDFKDNYLDNANLIAKSPKMYEWIARVVAQAGWVYQKDLDGAKKLLTKEVR